MRIPSASPRLGSLALLLLAACGDNLTTLYPDASLAVGSGNSTSLGRGGGGSNQTDAGLPIAATTSLACANDADCVSGDPCRDGQRCVFGLCVTGQARCVDGDPCTLDVCTPATGACEFLPVEDRGACQDNDLCDGQVCLAGACTAGEPRECFEDGNPCSADACSPLTGECVTTILADGAPCPDSDPCNGSEVCSSGFCRVGTPLDCNDNDPCTVDLCNALSGCARVPVPDGTACADLDACNGNEICSGGLCRSGLPIVCFDGNPCTSDACQRETGACSFSALPNAMPCPDGDLCDGQTCLNGACQPGRPVVCADDNDGNACTRNTCNPLTSLCYTSALPDGTTCPDVNACDGIETCRAGQCTGRGTRTVCSDDANPCTRDACDPAWGCVHLNVPDGTSCADANVCNGGELCFGGRCSVGQPMRCEDGNTCTIDVCIPSAGCLNLAAPDGAPCSDGNVCNGAEVCTSARCVGSNAPPACVDDANPCTRDLCDPNWGCLHPGVPNGTTCADANACNGAEACNNGLCIAGAPVICGALTACNPRLGLCE